MIGSGLAVGLGLALALIQLVLIVGHARPAFGRSGCAEEGAHAFSMLVGRAMVLVAALGLALFDVPLKTATGSSAFAVTAVAAVALAVQNALEKWRPRGGGTRPSDSNRPTVRATLGFGYLAAVGIALVIYLGALIFSLMAGAKPDPVVPYETEVICSASGPCGFIATPAPAPGSPEAESVLTAAGLLVVVALLAAMAIVRALRRRRLVGLETEDDARDRRISARRAARAFMAACIGAAAAMAGDVADALKSSATSTLSTDQLAAALSQYLIYVEIACAVVIVGVSLAGLPSRWQRLRATREMDTAG